MNKQKKALLTVLMVATLIMGVAYAAVTTVTLTISGKVTTTAAKDNFKVYFTGVVNNNSDSAVNASATNGTTSATLNISELSKKGDTKYAIFEIINASNDIDASSVNVTAHNVDTTIIQVDAEMCTEAGAAITDYAVKSGAKTYVKVSATLLQTPTADNTVTDIEVTIDAVPQQAA